MIWQDFDVI